MASIERLISSKEEELRNLEREKKLKDWNLEKITK